MFAKDQTRWKSTLVAIALATAIIVMMAEVRPAWAVLGEGSDSVRTDQSVMRGEMATSAHPDFTVKQISTARGVVVNEYVSNSGTVFAVSWRGPRPPDLSQLLGSYFSEYQAAASQPRPHRERRHVHIKTDNVVVEGGGHMRSLWGRAYVPSLLPPGVNLEDIH
ncbi:MAG: DUF2844 domain-containing protein [Candidatus Binataceae bacterium]